MEEIKEIKASELAGMVKGDLIGPDDPVISALMDFDSAGPGQISFLSGKIRPEQIDACRASLLLVPRGSSAQTIPTIEVDDPVWAAAVIHSRFLAREFVAEGIHQSSVIGDECEIPREVSIAQLVCLGDRVRIGSRVRICPGCVIGNDVEIGDDCLLHPNVTVLDGSILGNRVILHSGTVVGSDGFGYAHDRQGHHLKRPHVGYVQIDDDVELGANVCVDRGTFGRTWIKKGTKIDNLVQVAHNVIIGEDSILVSQSGISGSTVLGDGVIMGGKAAVSGHLQVGNRVTIAAKSGVAANVGDGEVVAGFPAMPHKKWLRTVTSLPRVPDLLKEVRELKKQVADLLERVGITKN